MTKIFNDPADFADEALAGFCDAHSDLVRQVDGGAVRRNRPASPKVAVITGGGSGHYPAFAGIIGPGFADGAVVGNIFTSPSSQQAYSVAKAADSGAGVVFTYGNYAGDVMNFGMASERLNAEGIRAENVLVTDDIASASPGEIGKRRGIAGDFVVFKVMGAAAEAGLDLDAVVRLGRKANGLTRTIGTAFGGCTFPGADQPLFRLPEGQMGLGLGIHGEPGLFDTELPSAVELGRELVRRVLAETPAGASRRLAVILNGLGSTKHEELFVLWRTVAPLLREAGYTLVMPEVGELVTSLDMAGASLTLTWLDDELEQYWTAPALTPAYRRGSVGFDAGVSEVVHEDSATETADYSSTAESRAYAAQCLSALDTTASLLRASESMLGDMDAIAGDGDHGRGMVRGSAAANEAAATAFERGAGAGSVLIAAGDAWADKAGGTLGVLWGAGLRAFGERLGDAETPTPDVLAESVRAFADRIAGLGKAEMGDKTMMDALLPFAASLEERIASGIPVEEAWAVAATDASAAAASTADLRPLKGRARPLAEKSLGTPDPGATSLAMVFTAVGPHFTAVPVAAVTN
ncbi:dihydroxyacetone kinase family protein [Paenarthrobacter nicotinovorans]|uniref:dihydroxyacetone kinase family protein n=1 Tax=Paenarthrobacter nicotinovorans TaxID=29320 RepID=UPI00166E1C8D|nr:dihydroxyacetone kinase family protein [Paenarthrobacter nicotinovorans]MBP2394645.1 dihydroxyacetone kinase [Paenarthrobacter nicotinovorans]UKE99180.1 dihydroxyacetone kinase family protein [Paenarthrobacter nicotinovorans]UKF03960.1 dihydroxyacetone kinase family protein [Paenarthrobacter nicotinovorans]GGV42691.1 D-erythrulose kinase [Paenarthrobacter nicotinovorans]